MSNNISQNLENKSYNIPLEEVIPTKVFKAEVKTWAERIGVKPKEIQVRKMKRKWGSCSGTGRVTFNAELLTKPAAFRAEIIAHELLHLRIPNHGRLFQVILKSYLMKWGSSWRIE